MPLPTDVKQIPLQPGQFAWCRDEKSGGLRMYVGPCRLTPTDDDVFLRQDPENPSRLIVAASLAEAVQDFVTIKPGEYAVVHNPVKALKEGYPNGQFTADKNSLEALNYGKTKVLTEGYFPIWPGQRIEIRPMHELQSNEYLIARVIDENSIDEQAPFFSLTQECATITAAVADATALAAPLVQSGEEGKKVEPSEGTTEHVEGEDKPPAGDGNNQPKADESAKPVPTVRLRTGQQIVIPGSKTPIYIPPTGIEVVPDTSIDDSGRPVTPNMARQLLEKFERQSADAAVAKGLAMQRGGPSYATTGIDPAAIIGRLQKKMQAGELNVIGLKAMLPTDQASMFVQNFQRAKDSSYNDQGAAKFALEQLSASTLAKMVESARLFEEPDFNLQEGTISGVAVDDLKLIAEGPRLVRQAVVLGPTEYCVLLDVDGRPQIHKGPGRVFPGPYDRFQTKGSRNRVYDAYHLRSDRGLLIRIIAEQITKEVLSKELPQGLPGNVLDKTFFLKGDEVFIAGFDAYLVPSNSFEVIDPESRIPHIGNDHAKVYVQAIGVDQKSGVYVMNVETGQIELLRGEKKLLLDPRKHKHVQRSVPGRAWNLMIGRAEPHKMVDETAIVKTPWALSVIIPNNEAVLVTSKEGRRVVIGPCTELLGYEEWLEKLTLSAGRPKSEVRKVETCFLRVSGNRVTDRIDLETSDFVTIKVDVSYGVTFTGETREERYKWFDHRNYVRLLYTHLRSRLRAAARAKSLMELQPIIPDFVRDVVLGSKKEGEHRAGLKLANNMLVDEVEVLEIDIPDDEVSRHMETSQRETVIRQIGDANLKATLESNKLRDAVAEEQLKLDEAALVRKSELSMRQNEVDHDIVIDKTEKTHVVALLARNNEDAVLDQKADKQRERDKKAADQRRELLRSDEELQEEIVEGKNALRVKLEQELATIHKELIGAGADAVAKQFGAIQIGLIEALEGLGDKQVLAALAEHLPEAGGALGFLLGQGGLESIKSMIAGTPLAQVIEKLGANKSRMRPDQPNATDSTQ